MAIYDTIKSRSRGRKTSQEDLIEVIDDDIEVVPSKTDKRRKGTPKKETSEVVESNNDKTSKTNEKVSSKDDKSDSSWGDLPLTGPGESPKKYTPAIKHKENSPSIAKKDLEKTSFQENTQVKCGGDKNSSKKRDREEYREKPFVPNATLNIDEWNCIMCFLPNLMEDLACVRCLTNRPGAKKSYRWTCSTCTTSNPKSVTTCRLCNSDSSSSSGNESA